MGVLRKLYVKKFLNVKPYLVQYVNLTDIKKEYAQDVSRCYDALPLHSRRGDDVTGDTLNKWIKRSAEVPTVLSDIVNSVVTWVFAYSV